MKKAQIPSQVFMYVFALLVISLILFFGIKAISNFKMQTEEIEIVKFETDLKEIVSSVSSEYNTIRKVELSLPREFKYVCFADKTGESDLSNFPLIENAIDDGTTDNVFLVKDVLERSFRTVSLEVKDSNFLCISNTRGVITFTLKGKSRYAEIYP